jgi:hypothetical protein
VCISTEVCFVSCWDPESGIRKKVDKAMGTFQVSMESIYDIDVPSKVCCSFLLIQNFL